MNKIYCLLLIFTILLSCTKDEQVSENNANKFNGIYKWKIATAWDKDLPILADAVKNMTKEIEIMSKGQIQFEIYPAGYVHSKNGDIVETSKLWKAVSENDIQIMHAVSYYWVKDIPSSVFFGALPFGMSYNEMNGWFNNSNGLELWRDLYADYNLIPFPCGGSGNQMGGWFNKEINNIDDFKDIKMRIAGLGGKVIEKAGATAISVEQRKIKNYLEDGFIDAAEWIGPYHDYIMNLNEVARYYYEPGWQEPNVIFELTINKKAFEVLPPDLQEIIKTISFKYNTIIYSSFADKNLEYRKILESKNTQFKSFSKPILTKLEEYSKIVIQEYINKDTSKKSEIIYDSYYKYQKEKVIIKKKQFDSPNNNAPNLMINGKTNTENSFWDKLDNIWGVIGISVAVLTMLISSFFHIQKQKRFKKMLLKANNLLKDYFEGKETTTKIVDLRATIGHFLENHYIKEIQYNVLSNKISEIQNIIELKSTITDELKNEIEDIIADGKITEKEYHKLIHLIKSKKLFAKNRL